MMTWIGTLMTLQLFLLQRVVEQAGPLFVSLSSRAQTSLSDIMDCLAMLMQSQTELQHFVICIIDLMLECFERLEREIRDLYILTVSVVFLVCHFGTKKWSNFGSVFIYVEIIGLSYNHANFVIFQ